MSEAMPDKVVWVMIILLFIGAVTTVIIAILIVTRILKSLCNMFAGMNANQRRKQIRRTKRKTKKKTARDYAAMTPQERQKEFFNACWNEIENGSRSYGGSKKRSRK